VAKTPKPFHELPLKRQQEFYKAWVRERGCRWCGSARRVAAVPIHASHHHESTEGPHGLGLKTSDYRTIGLCEPCHYLFHITGRLITRAGLILTADETRNFLQRAVIDNLVEFLETILNPEVF